MKIKVKKTDKRHTAHNKFGYFVDIKMDKYTEREAVYEKFFELRLWCWETWGPSREVDQCNTMKDTEPKDKNSHWGWINDQFRSRIYLASPDEAAYFTLKWS